MNSFLGHDECKRRKEMAAAAHAASQAIFGGGSGNYANTGCDYTSEQLHEYGYYRHNMDRTTSMDRCVLDTNFGVPFLVSSVSHSQFSRVYGAKQNAA